MLSSDTIKNNKSQSGPRAALAEADEDPLSLVSQIFNSPLITFLFQVSFVYFGGFFVGGGGVHEEGEANRRQQKKNPS